MLSLKPTDILGITVHAYPSTIIDIHAYPGIIVDLQDILDSLDYVCVALGYLRAHVGSPLELSWRYIVINLDCLWKPWHDICGYRGVSLESMP